VVLEPAAAFASGDYEAYEHYLRGRYLCSTRTPDGLRQAVELFQRAIDANPDDARYHAALADAYTLLGLWSYAPEEDVIPKARAEALEALELDGNLAAAHTSLAQINQVYDMDWQSAEARFRKAIELDPNYATAHHWYAEYLGAQGRFDEAQAEIARARRLDPRSMIIATDHGYILNYAHQFDRAIEEFRAVLAVEPTFSRAIGGLIGAYVNQGRFAEAFAEARRWQQLEDGPWQRTALAHIHGRMGELDQAERALRGAEEAARRLGRDPLELRGFVYLGMGRKEEVLAVMQEACEKYPRKLNNIRVEPMYDWLRNDPRFQELVRCAGYEP
jgi:tetratricopeptide (TPR) repeat protein